MISAMNTLETVELGRSEEAQYSVIWLHGLGADGHDFVPLVPELRLPTSKKMHFIFPHAPYRKVTMYEGRPLRAWFDITNLNFSGDVDEAGIAESIAGVNQLIEQEIAQGIPAKNIFIAGFSQGGYIALLSGLFYPQQLAGIIGLSTFLWQTPQFDNHRQAANQTTPILIAHGTQDYLVPYQAGENAVRILNERGYDVTFQSYKMGHAVCNEETAAISHWLQQYC